MLQKIALIKLTIVLLISINLVNNVNHRKEVRKKYLSFISQEFDRDLKVRNFALQQLLVKQVKMEESRDVKKRDISRGGSIQEETFVLTFYTSLDEENGYGPITCSGSKLRSGMVANNVLRQGTKIITNEYGELVVADRGGNNFNTRHRLDVFISRRKGESDYQYKRRVNSMGVVKVKGYIIK